MLKRDYMKEIENGLTLVRDAIDQAIASKNKEEAKKVINRELRGLVGLDVDTVNSLSFSSIKELISSEREFNSEKYLALAEILRCRGKINEDAGEMIFYYNKSLKAFYEVILDDEALVQTYLEGVSNMVSELKEYELNLHEKEAVFKGYQLLGQYDRAEDVIFSMINESKNDKSVIELGIEFYERLESKDEKILEEGNLPIDEVKDSLKELKGLME